MNKISLSELCEILIGRTPSRSVKEYWGKGHKWVSIADMKEEIITSTKEEITEEAINSIRCRKIPKGTLLLSFKLSVGKLAFAGTELYTNEAIAGLIVKDETVLDSKYLYYVLKKIKFVGGNRAVMGITLNSKSLAELEIPLPSLEDQIRIATILTRAEALIVKRKESIKLLDEFLKSTFFEMFGDPVRNEKGWDFIPLENKIKIKHGYAFSGEFFSDKGEYVLLTPGNFYEDGGYRNRGDKQKYYKGEIPGAYILNKGDLLVAMTEQASGLLGSPIIVPEANKFLHNQRLGLVISKQDEVNNEFLFHLFNHKNIRYQIDSKATGTKVRHTSPTKIEKICTYMPPIDLQNKFATIVEKVESIKAKYTQNLTELENLYGSLSQRAFKGELDLSRVPIEDVAINADISGEENYNPFEGEIPYSRENLVNIIEKLGNSYTFDFLMEEIYHKTSWIDGAPDYEKLKNDIFDLLGRENPRLTQKLIDIKEKDGKIQTQIGLRVIK